jgi:GNAT superfamily N-acetyltransferase
MTLETRPYAPGDETAIQELFALTYGKPIAPELWRWRFLDNPYAPPVIDLAWDGDVLAAHYAVSPVMLAIDGEPRLAALSGTTMTHPDYRRRGLFVQLASSVYERLANEGYASVWGFPNGQSHHGIVRDLQWRNVHEIPTLRLDLTKAKPVATAGGVEELMAADARIDLLWERCRRLRPLMGWRDAQHVQWRYLRHPTNRYRLLVADSGYAVFKRFGDEVDLVDLLVADDDEAAVRALVGAVIERSDGAQAMNTWMPLDSRQHLELERLGFGTAAPTTYLGIRPFVATRFDVSDVRNWHYSMGDSDVY